MRGTMFWVFAAHAGDVWVGAGTTGGVSLDGSEVVGEPLQAEVDFRYASGSVLVRVDADIHWDPADPDTFPALPLPPEWAMVQFGKEKYLRVGVSNPNIGFFEWDMWENYLPRYGQSWTYQISQNLGFEAGMTTAGGVTPFVWAGYDLGWFAPMAGAGVATEQDLWAVWAGAFSYPVAFDCEGYDGAGYHAASAAAEFYPSDALWLAIDGTGGLYCGHGVVSGQVLVSLLPEAIVAPVVRLEGTRDPEAVGNGNQLGVSLGAHSSPVAWLWIGVEERMLLVAGEPTFRSTVVLGVHRPEPPDGAAAYEDEE